MGTRNFLPIIFHFIGGPPRGFNAQTTERRAEASQSQSLQRQQFFYIIYNICRRLSWAESNHRAKTERWVTLLYKDLFRAAEKLQSNQIAGFKRWNVWNVWNLRVGRGSPRVLEAENRFLASWP